MNRLLTLLLTASVVLSSQADERPHVPAPDGLRAGGTLYQTLPAPPIAGEPRASGREVRNYPEQPPVIPHSIRNYQVDARFNRCLECHNRNAAPAAGAPMVSITHYVDRNGQTRAAVTPGRYFCTQCHVPQTDADPLVQSDFQSIDQLLQRDQQGGQP
ncbi:nitrate reductase cytochrome c-type subunit [Halopseudomonas salegens]|uniref:Periplasmic nitrate reductase, electron transfer subunit n=1 Tax=Halopseudomonas salegens TaxID=1434072 RepID=A0A1H2H9J6_9GAMM|nr:nitrate reductase cytochrome c-type subunit [Halopseudomonas salegens]SDU28409.1 periplasmic nitrate reductase subunit NapB [Halopseudomonas salegens]